MVLSSEWLLVNGCDMKRALPLQPFFDMQLARRESARLSSDECHYVFFDTPSPTPPPPPCLEDIGATRLVATLLANAPGNVEARPQYRPYALTLHVQRRPQGHIGRGGGSHTEHMRTSEVDRVCTFQP